jgi:hypothetical protein
MMNALAAGGIPVVGPAPAYECPETMFPVSGKWLAEQAGSAVKVIDPHRSPEIRSAPFYLIWMTRHLMEQARSQAKLLHLLSAAPMPNRAGLRALATSLYADERRFLRGGGPLAGTIVRFEELLAAPKQVMGVLAERLAEHWTLDAAAAAAVIRMRDPRCAPGLDQEAAMIEAAQ